MARAERRAEGPVGFSVELDAAPGATMARIRDLERAIEDYAEAHDLDISGTQLRLDVRAKGRLMTADDQVALLDWLVDRPGLRRIRLGALSGDGGVQAGYLQVASGDMAVMGVTLLYRLGRLKAEQYLQILGGFVRAGVH
ncbi:hypothetical protein D621_02840 [beta proteobacterium AAP51]|nr:hypothetical protein D621_02840 [beta proteobacterium AAP51]